MCWRDSIVLCATLQPMYFGSTAKINYSSAQTCPIVVRILLPDTRTFWDRLHEKMFMTNDTTLEARVPPCRTHQELCVYLTPAPCFPPPVRQRRHEKALSASDLKTALRTNILLFMMFGSLGFRKCPNGLLCSPYHDAVVHLD